MYNHNVFAVLIAIDQRNMARSAFRLVHNLKWFREAIGGVAREPIIDSRETTPAVDEDDPEAAESLVITFDLLSENLQNGIQFGTNPDLCHILLGYRGTLGVSGKQCNIIVDSNLRIWLHDYRSSHGTAVGHDEQNEAEVRKMETWILAYEPGSADRFEVTTIHFGSLVFKIEFPNHDAAHPAYVKNLRAFVDKCTPAVQTTAQVPNIEELSINNGALFPAATKGPNAGQQLIYYKGETLENSGCDEVQKVFRARDGLVFAAKIFRRLPSKRKQEDELPAWLTKIRREFTLMSENPHPNVAQVIELQEKSELMIVMHYYPDGDMVNARIFDEARRISAFGQVLEALSHLHANGIVHRDLNPESILVQLKPYFKVVITDFSLAEIITDNAWPKTSCGTLEYVTPEVSPGFSENHVFLADVWSAGVMGIEWIYDLPASPEIPTPEEPGQEISPKSWSEWVRAWGLSLFEKLREEAKAGDVMIDILSHMVEMDPNTRWTAKKCLMTGLESGIFKRRNADGLIVCADYREEDEVQN